MERRACRNIGVATDGVRRNQASEMYASLLSGFCGSGCGDGSAFRRSFRLFLCRAIPLKRAPQALLKSNRWVVAKKFAGLRNVRLRIANIAVARRFVLRFEVLAGNFIQKRH